MRRFFYYATDNSDYVKYLDAVKQGLLTERDIDRSLERLFSARFKLGLFDPPESVAYAQTPDSEIDSEAHRALALKVARESMVLLKNNGLLPLTPEVRKIAVFGPLAESVRVLHGNYSGTASHATTALEGIRKQFAVDVSFNPGMNFLREPAVIPSEVLSSESGQAGLTGEYFPGATLAGTPQLVRVDQKIDLRLAHPDADALVPPSDMKDFQYGGRDS